MVLAAGVSPRLRPPGPRAAGRQGRSRGFSSGCARPDRNKEAAEAEAGVAPCGPEEADRSVVNGEGSGRAGTPLILGMAELGARAGVGPARLGPVSDRDHCSLAGRSPAVLKHSVVQAPTDPEHGGSGTARLHLARAGERCGTSRERQRQRYGWSSVRASPLSHVLTSVQKSPKYTWDLKISNRDRMMAQVDPRGVPTDKCR